jgi:chemotaxis protein methyltransferase CheR
MIATTMRAQEPPRASAPTEAPALSDADFKRIAAILYEDSGIHLPDGKNSLVYSRLAKRLRALGLESFNDYCALVSSREGVSERQSMLSALTTNVTRFFREEHHFEDLAKQLQPWVANARAGGKLRIWSAGCSSGEEPYSIALTLLGVMPDAARHDVRILATDIDPKIVERAREGVYPEDSVKPVPAALREKYLERLSGGRYSIGESARDLVSFRELNLMAKWPMKGKFQAIFCRNVAIYFQEETQERLWGRFGDLMGPDSKLYVGHSERVGDAVRFRSDGLTAYRLAGGAK